LDKLETPIFLVDIFRLQLKVGSGVACAFEGDKGLDIVDLI